MSEASKQAEQAAMFANRLRKLMRQRRRWAQREGVSCFRLYDQDIPEIPLVVDWYEGRLHMAEYVRRHERTPEEHDAWLDALVCAACEALEVPESSAYLKRRERQRGLAQYQRFASEGARCVVSEGGHRFWVNLSDYLDTGLFLDHRPTRRRVEGEASGRRVLNLFGYTGAFTVYAAAGGASETLTVDLSNTYLRWAQENLALNGLDQPQHRLLRADCCLWLREDEEAFGFDLAVVDPPSFSNSTSMSGTWDVQRDHVWLLRSVLARMRPGGVVYFSTNRRGFRLDRAEVPAEVEEISARSVPEDFRDRSIHRCFRMIAG